MKLKIRENTKKSMVFFAVLVIIGFLALSFASPVEAELTTWQKIGVVAGSTMVGAGVGGMIGGPIGAAAGAAAGAVAGTLTVLWGSAAGEASVSNDAQEAYANDLKIQQQNLFNMANSESHNTLELYNTSAYYFARKAEWAAITLNDSGADSYDAEFVLKDVAKGTNSYTWSQINKYTALVKAFGTVGNYYVGTYAGMKTELVSFGLGFPAISNVSQNFKGVYAIKMQPNKYYYYAPQPIYFVSLTAGEHYFKAYDINGRVLVDKTVTLGAQEVYNLRNGGYKFSENVLAKIDTDMEIFGLGIKTVDKTITGYTYPALLCFEHDKNTGKISLPGIIYYDGAVEVWDKDLSPPSYQPTDDMWIENIYSGGWNKVIITSAFLHINDTINAANAMLVTANSYGVAMWDYLQSHVSGYTNVPPDIVFPDPSQLSNFSTDEIYVMYIAYLKALQKEMKNNTKLSYEDINVSAESFQNLRVTGYIYNQTGKLIWGTYNSTGALVSGYAPHVFLPLVSIKNMNLTSGANNTMEQSAFVLDLGVAKSENSSETIADDILYRPVAIGSNISVTHIEIEGQAVNNTTLTVTKLQFIVPDISSPGAPLSISGLAEGIANWTKEHIITTALVVLGFAVIAFAPQKSKWMSIIFFGGAALAYYVIEPALGSSLLSGIFQQIKIMEFLQWR